MNLWSAFWAWYERTYTLNISVALGLFLLQIVHLIWLFGEVVWARAFGAPLFALSGAHEILIVLVDYTEIPALISVSLIYIDELRRNWSSEAFIYLVFLNSQWLHLFWISDEFVVAAFTGSAPIALPLWLAWVAIAIDFLEVPVMVDTVRRFLRATKDHHLLDFLKHELH